MQLFFYINIGSKPLNAEELNNNNIMNTITLENKKDKKYEIYDSLVKQDWSLGWVNNRKTIATGSVLSFEVKDDNVIITSNYFTETSLRSFVSEI